ncbi:MAG: SDR family NAD(P)-dependent oxidoreductase [Methanothrix sp.]
MIQKIKGKTALVTGGTGSIGSEIVRQLLSGGAEKVVVFSRDEIKHFMLKKRVTDERLETVVGDVRDYSSIKRAFEAYDFDIVYHAAAMKHVVVCDKFPLECSRTNILGTQNVVDLARSRGVPGFIAISTDKAAAPVNVMGASKLISEAIALNGGYTCVRFGNVASSRGSVIPVFVDNLMRGNPVSITDPEATRFIIGIPDAVRLVMEATEITRGGEIFILKMKAFRLGDLLDVIVDACRETGILRGRADIREIGLIAGEKLHEDLISPTEAGSLYDLGDKYVILRSPDRCSLYPGIVRADLPRYTSEDVDLASRTDLREMVMEYINSIKGSHGCS